MYYICACIIVIYKIIRTSPYRVICGQILATTTLPGTDWRLNYYLVNERMNKYRLPNKKTLVRKSCVAPKENSPSLFKQEKGSCLYSVISGTEGGAASAMRLLSVGSCFVVDRDVHTFSTFSLSQNHWQSLQLDLLGKWQLLGIQV